MNVFKSFRTPRSSGLPDEPPLLSRQAILPIQGSCWMRAPFGVSTSHDGSSRQVGTFVASVLSPLMKNSVFAWFVLSTRRRAGRKKKNVSRRSGTRLRVFLSTRREDGGESNKTEKDDDDQRSTSQVSNSFTGSSLNVALPCPFASSTRTRLIHPWLSTTTAGNANSRLLSELWIRITPRKVEVRL